MLRLIQVHLRLFHLKSSHIEESKSTSFGVIHAVMEIT